MNSRFELFRDWLIVGVIFLTLGVVVSFGLEMNQAVQENNNQSYYVVAANGEAEAPASPPQSEDPKEDPQTTQNLNFFKLFGLIVLGIVLFFLLLSALVVALLGLLRKFLARHPAG